MVENDPIPPYLEVIPADSSMRAESCLVIGIKEEHVPDPMIIFRLAERYGAITDGLVVKFSGEKRQMIINYDDMRAEVDQRRSKEI